MTDDLKQRAEEYERLRNVASMEPWDIAAVRSGPGLVEIADDEGGTAATLMFVEDAKFTVHARNSSIVADLWAEVEKLRQETRCQQDLVSQLSIDKARLQNEVAALHAIADGEVWYWQDDEDDHPESLTCPVVMHANVLMSKLSEIKKLQASYLFLVETMEVAGIPVAENMKWLKDKIESMEQAATEPHEGGE